MSKKTLIVIGFALVIILLVLVGYYILIKPNDSGTDNKPSIFKNFFPFGNNNTSTTTEETRPIIEEPKKITDFTQKLRKLSSEPVAGAGVSLVKAGTIVRYIEKATGHIFEVELFSPNQNRISNKTLSLVYDAMWSSKNDSLIARYLKDDLKTIDTYSLSIKLSSSTESNISGTLFPSGISDYDLFSNNIFYIQQNQSGSVGITASIDGNKKKQIWDSPIKEVLPQYVNLNTVAITTKPYQGIGGFLYFVNTANGQVKKILSNISGLSALANGDATKVLAISQENDLQTFLYTLSDKSQTILTPKTFPEKCVWGKKDKNTIYCAVPEESLTGDSLTSWYMGLVSFTDDIWKYDLKNNTSSIISYLYNESGEAIDAIKPILNDGEKYLVFINKRNGSLWSLDLSK